jgi:formylmethanofuran dehydrogenase subunit D
VISANRIIPASIAIVLLLASVCAAEGLDVLIQVAKSQAEIKNQYEEETKNFKKVKVAIENGAIKKGQSKAEIQSRYGAPVVSVKDADGRREDCIYKPDTSSFFKGVRATLVYTEQGVLDETRVEDVK